MGENKIAVICAYNPRNCGMYSVDLAASQYLKKLGKNFTMFTSQYKRRLQGRSWGKLKFERLRSASQLKDYQTVLYWGDFVNNPAYGRGDYSWRDVHYGLSADSESAFKKWKELFLLDGVEKPPRVFSISNNFQTLDDYASADNGEEVDSIRRLMKANFDGFYPRDSLSSDRLREFFAPQEVSVSTAVDAAFLLDPEELYPDLISIQETPSFAYFFARSGMTDVSSALRKVKEATGCRPMKIDNWLSMGRIRADATYHKALKTMKASSFVVSDTYHVLVNALNLGKKVIGVGAVSNRQEGTCGCYKKKVLLEEFGLGAYWCEFSERFSSSDCLASAAMGIEKQDLHRIGELKSAYKQQLKEHVL